MRCLFIVTLLFILISCEKRKESFFKKIQTPDYIEIIHEAETFHSEETVKVAIEYLDNILNTGESSFYSIYYDKARLLYLSGRSEEALETINLTKNKIYEIHKAALYICLDREDDAIKLLTELYNYYMNILAANKDSKQRDNLFSILITINILLDRNNDDLIRDVFKENIFFEEMNKFQNFSQLTKADIIKSMWPKKGAQEMPISNIEGITQDVEKNYE
jgi:tetratricopeptide (TPR) repeat protein